MDTLGLEDIEGFKVGLKLVLGDTEGPSEALGPRVGDLLVVAPRDGI